MVIDPAHAPRGSATDGPGTRRRHRDTVIHHGVAAIAVVLGLALLMSAALVSTATNARAATATVDWVRRTATRCSAVRPSPTPARAS